MLLERVLPIGILVALVGAGCDGRPPPSVPSRAVVADLRRALAAFAEGPLAGRAGDALDEAAAAVEQAEQIFSDPRASVADRDDAAYVARRMVERARIAALYAADREALDRARGTVWRLDAEARRRAAFFARLRDERRAEAEAILGAKAERRAALLAALGAGAEIREVPEGTLVRLAPQRIFIAETSILRDGAAPLLAALAAALRAPACEVRLAVLDDDPYAAAEDRALAERRKKRIHDILEANGVPGNAFLPPPIDLACGTQIDLLVVERPTRSTASRDHAAAPAEAARPVGRETW